VGAVPLQRAFDLSAGFVLTLRSSTPVVPVRKRSRWHPRAVWWRLTHRRFASPVPVAADPPLEFPVPPLTLGRFLDLMASDWVVMTRRLLGSDCSGGGADAAELLGRQLAGIDHGAFTGPVCAVVPGMTADVWEKHGDTVSAFRLVDYFTKAHDWGLIGKAIAWGEEKVDEETPTRATVTAALLTFCRNFPTQTPRDLLETRVEGFFYLRDGATETLRGSEPEAEEGDILAPGQGIADGAGLINDTERRSSLWGSIDAADKAVQ
jgi:hypothetical protein